MSYTVPNVHKQLTHQTIYRHLVYREADGHSMNLTTLWWVQFSMNDLIAI